MPYRETNLTSLCAVCSTITERACRRCTRPLCREHSNELAFYVPTVECLTAERCVPPTAMKVRHPHRRSARVMFTSTYWWGSKDSVR